MQARSVRVRAEIYFYGFERDLMAQRNQIKSTLGCHDPGQPGGRQCLAFFERAPSYGGERTWIHSDGAPSDCFPPCDRLIAYVDHPDTAGGVEMGQLGYFGGFCASARFGCHRECGRAYAGRTPVYNNHNAAARRRSGQISEWR